MTYYCYSYSDSRHAFANLLGNADLHDKFRPIWGYNEEGEFNGVGGEVGDPRKVGNAFAGLWSIVGSLAVCRFYSKHVALRTYLHYCNHGVGEGLLTHSTVEIKAHQENVFGVRYSCGNDVIRL